MGQVIAYPISGSAEQMGNLSAFLSATKIPGEHEAAVAPDEDGRPLLTAEGTYLVVASLGWNSTIRTAAAQFGLQVGEPETFKAYAARLSTQRFEETRATPEYARAMRSLGADPTADLSTLMRQIATSIETRSTNEWDRLVGVTAKHFGNLLGRLTAIDRDIPMYALDRAIQGALNEFMDERAQVFDLNRATGGPEAEFPMMLDSDFMHLPDTLGDATDVDELISGIETYCQKFAIFAVPAAEGIAERFGKEFPLPD